MRRGAFPGGILIKINWRDLTVYFFLPLAAMAALVAMYFSGIPILETIVAMPHLEGVRPRTQRELGLMENLQVVLIAGAVFFALRSALKTSIFLPKILFGFIAAVSLFMLLEEIDYGLNYYEFLAGIPPYETAQTRNIHNIGDTHRYMKRAGDIMMILVFVIAPLTLRRVRAEWIRFLLPHPYFLLTYLVSFLTSTVAHALEDRGLGVGLEGNISEFRETVTYYIALLYILVLSRRTPPQPAKAGRTEEA